MGYPAFSHASYPEMSFDLFTMVADEYLKLNGSVTVQYFRLMHAGNDSLRGVGDFIRRRTAQFSRTSVRISGRSSMIDRLSPALSALLYPVKFR